MTVGELKDILKELPENLEVHINDNRNGAYFDYIDSVDHFVADDMDPECVVIQVNVD